jgi:hypothetical protein
MSGDQRIHDNQRQQHIDKIKRLIEAAGLVAKDFFLTQPPPPAGKTAYAGWKVRETSRQRIARYMVRHGITAHDLAPHAQIASTQLDMFPAAAEATTEPTTTHDLVGLAITLPEQCSRCGSHDAWIGAGRGPHRASVLCVCGRHLGWLSIATFNFINATVQQFGRPTEPICVNRQRATADVSRPVNANATIGECNGEYR